jgi:ABC-2 type transport system ATP-binding protein
MGAIATESLTRRFGPIVAVDDLTLELPDSGVVGLVGPNGSGKSTLIRMLLGLVTPTSGTAHILGNSIRHPAAYAHDVGALVENPAFVPGLSARRNLLSIARLRGLPASRVDEVLEVVGLTGRDREPARRFSLGMKQRLAIAAALLPDPKLLLLDEPTNGLDPAGIVEVRGLLQRLGKEGRTVVVSSHLMSEIEAACDYIVVIRFGVLMFSGPITELMKRADAHVDVRPERPGDLKTLRAKLASAGWAATIEGEDVRVAAGSERAAELNRAAAEAGFTLSRIVAVHESLEDVFLAMTGTTDGELARDRSGATEGGGR